jgi:hypothetical protein
MNVYEYKNLTLINTGTMQRKVAQVLLVMFTPNYYGKNNLSVLKEIGQS